MTYVVFLVLSLCDNVVMPKITIVAVNSVKNAMYPHGGRNSANIRMPHKIPSIDAKLSYFCTKCLNLFCISSPIHRYIRRGPGIVYCCRVRRRSSECFEFYGWPLAY